MKLELEPTGERVIEDAYRGSVGAYVIYLMHAASYGFVEAMCRDKDVLDLGCGSGYGTHRIAGVAASSTGVDVAADAVSFAGERYRAGNLSFRKISPDGPLPFADESFDVVLSFQVIEHVADVGTYLAEARRVLRRGGTLVVITPDRRHRLLPWQKPWNRWHLKEYSLASLSRAVEDVLPVTQALRMGAPWEIAGHEIRRYRWLKWLTLPVTLPFLPERLRRKGLDAMHLIKGRNAPVAADANVGPAVEPGFGEEGFVFGPDPPNPLNLVVVARKA